MKNLTRAALALLLASLPLGCLPDSGGPQEASSTETTPANPYAEYASLLIGTWDCVGKNDGDELTGRLEFPSRESTSGRMKVSTFFNARLVEVSFSYNSQCELEQNRLHHFGWLVLSPKATVDGKPIPQQDYPPTDMLPFDGVTTITRLDERALFLEIENGALECWRVR